MITKLPAPARQPARFGLLVALSAATAQASLISYYTFDDGTTVTDQIGANHGTVISGATFSTDTPDGSAHSLDLNAFNPQDYVRIGDPSPAGPDFNIGTTNSFTISMWVNSFFFSERGIVTIKQDFTSAGGDRSGITFGLNFDGNPFVGLIQSSGADDNFNGAGTNFHDVVTDQVLPFDTWTHMAATYNGATDTLAVYVDGVAATFYDDENGASLMNDDGTNLTNGVGVIDFVDANGSFTGFGAAGRGPQDDANSVGDFTLLYYDGLLDDVAIWDQALSAADIALLATGTSPPDIITDSDGDGMSDDYENTFAFLDPNDDSDADLDEDEDGLTNLEECRRGTAPDDEDSDDDGLSDGDEVNVHTTNPLVADTDGDGLNDGAEIAAGTDPKDADSDDDTIADGEEVIEGADGYVTNPLAADTDGDTLDDNVEIAAGTSPIDAGDFPQPPELGLVSYYNFDDGTTVTDQVGSNHGTVISSAGFSNDTPDGSPNSLDLSGTAPQDYVRIGAAWPDGPDFGIAETNSFTISMWVNYTFSERGIVTIKQDLTSGGGDRSGITFGIGGTGNPFLGFIVSSGSEMDDETNGAGATFRDVQTDQVVPTGAWAHLAATYDSGSDTMAIYLNGVAATAYNDGNGASTLNLDGTNLTNGLGLIDLVDANGSFTGFGASGNGPQHDSSAGDFTRLFYDGLLDEVGIWNVALPEETIAELAGGTSPPDVGGGLTPSRLIEIDFDFPNSSATLTWTSRPGQVYALESSTNLVNWSQLDDNIPSQGTTTTYTDMTVPDPSAVPLLFYRIQPAP